MADRPKLGIVDDPLRRSTSPAGAEGAAPPAPAPPAETAGSTTTSTPRSPGAGPRRASGRPARGGPAAPAPPALRDEATRDVFARLPRSIKRDLDAAHFELSQLREGLRKQDIIGALALRDVSPRSPAARKALLEAVDSYLAALERPST